MHANLASIMPQVIAVWCEQEGHDVTFVCYTGYENLVEAVPDNVDLLFIGAFTEAAHLAYALSHLYRSHGAVTVLGGPHARCYPQDAQQYFDYVLGFTDRVVIRDVLQDCSAHRPIGMHLAARQQPAALPGVRERWKFIAPTLQFLVAFLYGERITIAHVIAFPAIWIALGLYVTALLRAPRLPQPPE